MAAQHPADILQVHISELGNAIGRPSNLGRVTDGFFSKGLLTQTFVDDLETTSGLSAFDKSRKIVHKLHSLLQTGKDPKNDLIKICDVLLAQEDSTLKELSHIISKAASNTSTTSILTGATGTTVQSASPSRDVNVKKLISAIDEKLVGQYANLTGLPRANLRLVANQMYTQGIIGDGTNERPSYNDILSEFRGSLKFFKTLSDVQSHCQKFLTAMETVGGVVATAARALRKEWIDVAQTKFGVKLDI